MTLIKKNDLKKMSKEELNTKLKELKFELVKSSTPSQGANAKTKEIKRAISRLKSIRFNTSKEALKK